MLRTIQSRYILLRLQSYLPISYSRQFVSKIQYYILQITLRPRIIKQNDLAFHRFHIPSIQVFMSDSFLYEGTFFIWYMKDFIVLLKPYYLKYFRGWCTYRYFMKKNKKLKKDMAAVYKKPKIQSKLQQLQFNLPRSVCII